MNRAHHRIALSACTFFLFATALTLHTPVPAAESAAKPDFSGVWLPHGRKNAGQWPKNLPFTPAMVEARAKFAEEYLPIDAEIDDEHTSCIPYTMASAMMGIAQYPFEIVTTPGQVTLIMEIFGSVRRIYLGGRQPSSELLPTRMGFSTGRWDGDTLLIETTHLLAESEGSARPASRSQRIVERWRIIDSEEFEKELVNEITIHDPLVYTRPVTVTMHYKWADDIEVGEYLCHQDLWDQNMDGNPSSIPWRK